MQWAFTYTSANGVNVEFTSLENEYKIGDTIK